MTSRDDLTSSGERGVHAASLFVALAMAGLGWALATGDLTYRYVAVWSSWVMPTPYRMAAVWAGPSGTLLLWAVVLGCGASLATATLRRGSVLRAWTGALLALMLFAVLALAAFDVNPFLRLPFPPDDGRGVPLEWMRPVALLQAPVGYAAMTLVMIPAVLTVMGAMGGAGWREPARRWATACLSLLLVATLLDWRRRYGDGYWAGDWQWAPVHDGTALALAGAALLLLAALRGWPANAAIAAGFVAFSLALTGLAMRRAGGWSGVHDFAAGAAGRAAAWLALAALAALVVDAMRTQQGERGIGATALRVALGSVLVGAVALSVTSVGSSTTLAVREGESARAADAFGSLWMIALEGVSRVGRQDVISSVLALRASAGGTTRGYLTAEVRTLFARSSGQPVDQFDRAGTSAGVLQDLRVDVREANTADAVLDVRFVPGASLLWLAVLVSTLAALVAAFAPSRKAESAETAEPGQMAEATEVAALVAGAQPPGGNEP
ncbi:MAG: hypothetical protein FJ363_03570 [Gemmatimonadetes bacterium]|nr:hypothetical protein [Gemmatimonadota bacterium]